MTERLFHRCDIIGCERTAEHDRTLPGAPWVRRVCKPCNASLNASLQATLWVPEDQ